VAAAPHLAVLGRRGRPRQRSWVRFTVPTAAAATTMTEDSSTGTGGVVSIGLTYAVAGLCLLLAAVLPRLARGNPFSPAMAFTTVGFALGLMPIMTVQAPPAQGIWLDVVEQVTCLAVIFAVFGVGLAIDRPIGWRSWQPTWAAAVVRDAADDRRGRPARLVAAGAVRAGRVAAGCGPGTDRPGAGRRCAGGRTQRRPGG
jgi:hypothetical protein